MAVPGFRIHDDHVHEQRHVRGDLQRISGVEHLVLHPARRKPRAERIAAGIEPVPVRPRSSMTSGMGIEDFAERWFRA
jgi:Flp pilus assembly CpaE family ATPase